MIFTLIAFILSFFEIDYITVSALYVLAHFTAQNCQYIAKVDSGQNVQLTTLTSIAPNAFYAPFFISSVAFTMPSIITLFTSNGIGLLIK